MLDFKFENYEPWDFSFSIPTLRDCLESVKDIKEKIDRGEIPIYNNNISVDKKK